MMHAILATDILPSHILFDKRTVIVGDGGRYALHSYLWQVTN